MSSFSQCADRFSDESPAKYECQGHKVLRQTVLILNTPAHLVCIITYEGSFITLL